MGADRLGRQPERVGDLGVGHALGDQPGDLELADGERAPRLVHRAPARARSRRARPRAREQRRAAQPLGASRAPRARSGAASAWRFARSRRGARSSRAHVASQIRPMRVPAGDRRLEASRGPRRSSRPPAGAGPSAWSRAAGRRPAQSASAGATRSSQRSASSGRRAARSARTPVTTNGHQQRPLAGRRRASRASSQRSIGDVRLAGDERRLGEAPERAAGRARPRRSAGPIASDVVEQRARPLDLAAAEGHEAERVARAQRAAPAAALDELLSGDRDGVVPVARRPRRHAPTSRPSRGGSRTARSRRRSAGPRRAPISARRRSP